MVPVVAPFILIDQVFALAMQHAGDEPAYFRRYYAVVGSLFFVTWQVVTLLGLAFGSSVPPAGSSGSHQRSCSSAWWS